MKKSGLFLSALGLTLLLSANPGFAAGDDANLAKLGAFKKTDTGPMERVPQGGKYADGDAALGGRNRQRRIPREATCVCDAA